MPNATASTYLDKMDREIGLHTAAKVAGAFDLYYERGDWLWGAYMN